MQCLKITRYDCNNNNHNKNNNHNNNNKMQHDSVLIYKPESARMMIFPVLSYECPIISGGEWLMERCLNPMVHTVHKPQQTIKKCLKGT